MAFRVIVSPHRENTSPDDRRKLQLARERLEGREFLSRLWTATAEGRFSEDGFNSLAGVSRGRRVPARPAAE